jgi:hypothetical protein
MNRGIDSDRLNCTPIVGQEAERKKCCQRSCSWKTVVQSNPI